MTRRLILAGALLLATAPLGGCAVSLFSRETSPDAEESARIEALERRMDAVDRALGAR